MPHPERCAEEVLGNADGLALLGRRRRERGRRCGGVGAVSAEATLAEPSTADAGASSWRAPTA